MILSWVASARLSRRGASSTGGGEVVHTVWTESLSAEAANAHASGWFADNLAAAPGFRDPEADDLTLRGLIVQNGLGIRKAPLKVCYTFRSSDLQKVVVGLHFYSSAT